jgi:hypothetical protein
MLVLAAPVGAAASEQRSSAPPAAGPESDVLRLVVAPPGRAHDVAAAVRRRDGRVLRHLAGGEMLVAGPPAATRRLPLPCEVGPWSAERAIAPGLASLTAAAAGRSVGGVPVVVGLAPARRPRQLATELAVSGAEVRWIEEAGELPEIGLLVPADRLEAVREVLRRTEGLVFADLQPPIRLRNGASAWRCQSGQIGVTPLFEHGLDGEGQVVGVMDTGLDIDHCFFDDPEHGLPALNDDVGTAVDPGHRKVAAVDFYWGEDWPDPDALAWDDHGHGSHVAGSVAGDGGRWGLHDGDDGMAPAARLVIQDGGFTVDDCADLPGLGCPVRPLGPVLEQAWRQGARIHSNSWGDEENIPPFNRYTERTGDIDRFVWEHPEMVVLFAAGNAGPSRDTVSSPATGKNVIAVGATLHGDAEPPCVAGFSSRGWTRDGRIKPDVVAPGTVVVSAASDRRIDSGNCGTAAVSGTSMACPTVAGLAALVRQYFVDGYLARGERSPIDGFEPSAALVKATLVASAVDLSTLGCAAVEPVPSRDQGWGLVQLDRALAFAGDDERLVVLDRREGFAATGDAAQRLLLRVEAPGPLKVVLAWTDPPSSALAAANLVNDLDLELSGPGGTFLGNVLVDGVSVDGGDADHVNNVEVVWLPDAPAGRWTVTVRPSAVVEAPQPFALVAVGPVSADGTRGAGDRRRP